MIAAVLGYLFMALAILAFVALIVAPLLNPRQ